MTTDADSAIVEASRQVGVLSEFPRLTSLIDLTAAGELRPGSLGLASRPESGGVVWFLLAGDEATYADADALARAFVWPSFARGRRPAAHLPDGDAFAEEVRDRSPGGVLVLLSPLERALACASAIDLLFEARDRRPAGTVVAPRPIGRVLRDFDDAVARRDIAGSHDLLLEAWATGRLSLVNRSYLQVRVLAAQENWQEVLAHGIRHRMPDLDLPRVVEHDLIRAIYWSYLHESLEEGEIQEAISAFVEKVQPALGDVFRDHRGLPDAATRRTWMVRLAALGREWPPAVGDEIRTRASAAEQAVLDRIADAVSFGDGNGSAESAAALLTEREDSAAFSVAEASSGLTREERAAILVQSAVRLDDPARLRTAAEAVDQAGGPGGVPAPTALVDRVATYPRTVISVDGWATWLKALFEQPDWPDAVRMVDESGEAWTEAIAEERDSLDGVAEVVEALAGEESFRIVVPRLVRAAIPTGEDRAERVRVHRRLLEALAYAISEDPASGVADLDSLADILAALLEAGLTPEDFDHLATEIERVWHRIGAPARLARWVVDVMATVTTYPCPDDTRRGRLIGVLLAPLLADTARATPYVHREVWLEIKDLLVGSALNDLVPADLLDQAVAVDRGDADDFAHLEGRTIVLHTLVPGAANRAEDFIKQVIPSSQVYTDESHVGNNQLRDRLRKADVVVVASRAAKHAATDFIREQTSAPIAWASGKGWSSLVDALRTVSIG